jgi:hypothetical protein
MQSHVNPQAEAIYRLERFADGAPIIGEHPYAPVWR